MACALWSICWVSDSMVRRVSVTRWRRRAPALIEYPPRPFTTPDLKLFVSGPVVFQPDPYPRSPVIANTPISGDFSGLAWWRLHKKELAGKRIESTAVAGVLVPGPQQESGLYRGLNSGPGYLVGAVTGIASRSEYIWVGTTYQRYAESKGDRRPDLLTYTAV